MAYSKAKISIPNVTGNVVITVTATPSAEPYTNQVPISTDVEGNIYNEVGYKDGYRLNSSNTETSKDGSILTGFIPVKAGDVVRFSGEYVCGGEGGENSVFFGSDKTTFILRFSPYMFKSADPQLSNFEPYNYDASSHILYSFTVPNNSSIAYVRFTLHGTMGANAIITVNEVIPN